MEKCHSFKNLLVLYGLIQVSYKGKNMHAPLPDKFCQNRIEDLLDSAKIFAI